MEYSRSKSWSLNNIRILFLFLICPFFCVGFIFRHSLPQSTNDDPTVLGLTNPRSQQTQTEESTFSLNALNALAAVPEGSDWLSLDHMPVPELITMAMKL